MKSQQLPGIKPKMTAPSNRHKSLTLSVSCSGAHRVGRGMFLSLRVYPLWVVCTRAGRLECA